MPRQAGAQDEIEIDGDSARARLESDIRVFLGQWEDSSCLPSDAARGLVRYIAGYKALPEAVREIKHVGCEIHALDALIKQILDGDD